MDKIIKIDSIDDAKKILAKIDVSSQGVEVMSHKFFTIAIYLQDIEIGAANILKQEMLTIGADAAISRGIIEGEKALTDVILLGHSGKIQALLNRMKYYQKFNMPLIYQRIKKLMTNYRTDLTHQFSPLNKANKLPLIMGILNVTPDSFSDGGNYFSLDSAIQHAEKMISNGADILDIGGESSRPGAEKVSEEEEMKRVIPVIKLIRERSSIPISIDTTKAGVANKAIKAGANIINDISSLKFDGEMIELLKNNPEISLILMHMKGTPKTMQKSPFYDDVIDEILHFLQQRIDFCLENGIGKNRLIIDPGIGFGKRPEDNLQILKRLSDFHNLGVPVMLGASRKSFIHSIYPSVSEERLAGSLAATSLAFEHNIQIVRVHDVKIQKEFLQTLQSIQEN